MNKKIYLTLAILFSIILSFTFCFANDDNGFKKATNDVRNVVGGVENTIENVAMDISNVSKDATGDLENDAKDVTDNNNRNSVGGTVTGSNNGGYTTSRVSAEENSGMLGMSSTAWIWLIMGITAIAIIAVVWYYSMQFTNGRNHDNFD